MKTSWPRRAIKMAVFAYTATDDGRSATRGILIADTPRQARDVLRSRGLTIQRLAPQDAQRNQIIPLTRRRRAASIARFAGELSMLLGSGIPLLEAIDSIA